MANTFVNMDIYINSDGSFQILCPEIKNNNIILDYWTRKNDENKYIQKFFDSLTKQKLLHCYEKEDQRILIVQNDKKVKYKVVLHDYNRLLNIFKFNNLEMKMNKYWMKKAISKVGKKLNLKIENFIKKVPNQFVVAGSLLTASIMIPSIIASNNKINDTSTINNPSITQEANLDTSEEETEEIVINKDKINDSKDTDIKNNEKIETLIIDENDFKKIKKEERKNTNLLIVESAVLVEDHYNEICDELWYIYVEDAVRRNRLYYSRGYDNKKIDEIIAAQLPKEMFLKACDRVIDNSGIFAETMIQIDQIVKEL